MIIKLKVRLLLILIKKKNSFSDNTLNTIQKLKDLGDIEYMCAYYTLYFLGLSFYQLSKLKIKNIKKNCELLLFISYKYKKKKLIKKKIPKVMRQYFFKLIENKKNEGFLFFQNIKDLVGETRNKKIELILSKFMKDKLNLSAKYIKDFIEETSNERATIRLGSRSKYYFESFVHQRNLCNGSQIHSKEPNFLYP